MTLDDQLAQLWAAGASFTDMGLRLGESRNVIAGRIDRLRKAGDLRFKPRETKPGEPPPKPQRRPADEHVGNARPLSLSPEPPRPRTIEHLEPNECRWPVGQASTGRHLLCGRKTLRHPYCDRHAAQAKGAPAIGNRSR
jgi:hypothetical protein